MFSNFIKTLILIEDRRFNFHIGVDPISICRAFLVNINEKRLAQGGSTITQQLARMLYLNNKKTVSRKLKEILIALYLELKYSKKRILSLYSKNVYMGQNSSGKKIIGFAKASESYFGKSINTLTIAEYAALIAMIKGPNTYNPSSDSGIARRVMILGKMLDNGLITREEFFNACHVKF